MTGLSRLAVGPPVWPMYRAMVGIGVLCGATIVTVFEVTRPVIARNQRAALEQAVLDVLPHASSSVGFVVTESGRFGPSRREDGGDGVVYAGYDRSGQLVGVAIEARGTGYQDRIRLLYGYAPGQEAVVGFRILESRETPGLGDRVEKDRRFLENFVALDVSLTADMSRVAHPIDYVDPGEKTQPWEVDGISGATITSRAVTRILRESTLSWIPRIHANLTDFGEEG